MNEDDKDQIERVVWHEMTDNLLVNGFPVEPDDIREDGVMRQVCKAFAAGIEEYDRMMEDKE